MVYAERLALTQELTNGRFWLVAGCAKEPGGA
jgi:hypothetical protein